MYNSDANTETYLSFYMGDELLGIDVKFILEVLKGEQITEIPRSEDFIQGIINFRGEIVTVIDFHDKLNMISEKSDIQEIIIVVELFDEEKSMKIGLLADRVRKVFSINKNDIKSVPEFGHYYNPEYLNGVAKIEDGLVMLLDIEKVLNEKDVQIILELKNKK